MIYKLKAQNSNERSVYLLFLEYLVAMTPLSRANLVHSMSPNLFMTIFRFLGKFCFFPEVM